MVNFLAEIGLTDVTYCTCVMLANPNTHTHRFYFTLMDTSRSPVSVIESEDATSVHLSSRRREETRLKVRWQEGGGASRRSVNIREFKTPTQLSIIPDSFVSRLIYGCLGWGGGVMF